MFFYLPILTKQLLRNSRLACSLASKSYSIIGILLGKHGHVSRQPFSEKAHDIRFNLEFIYCMFVSESIFLKAAEILF